MKNPNNKVFAARISLQNWLSDALAQVAVWRPSQQVSSPALHPASFSPIFSSMRNSS
jgi:hypothetical protein